MRWDSLRLVDDEPPVGTTRALFAQGAVTRTFDTPRFRGITFHEIRARSIINRVPGASRVPFSWTINPYRGCSHACGYCCAGDTPILMADGRAASIEDVRVGDRIYGTRSDGEDRRYVHTTVLAHWRTDKPAYRVTLEDGTTLVTSGDHRFLTGGGWKHVTGGDTARRPHLTTDDRLVGMSGSRPRVVSVAALERVLPMYDITTGTGDFIANGVVSHNCFARKSHEYLEFDSGRDFDTQIVVKVNAAELARPELAAPKWAGGHIAMGTNVDCYQRAEGRYRLMPGIISALRDAANPFSILTKGSLILRDLELLAEAAEETDVSTNVSVGFTDRDIWRTLEAGTPDPRRRLEVCAALNDRGVGCGVLMGPIIPFLADSPGQIDATVAGIAAAGATHVSPIVLHLRPGAREWFFTWLRAHHPGLVARYESLYARGAYAPRRYQQMITDRVRESAHRHGVGRGPAGTRRITPARPPAAPPRPHPEQLTLM